MRRLLFATIALIYAAQIFAQNGTFTCSFDQQDFEVKRSAEYNFIDMQRGDLYYKMDPGTPALPHLPVNFAVPYGAEFIGITYSFDTILIKNETIIQPMLPAVALGSKKKVQSQVEPLMDIYTSSKPYPQNIAQYTSTQKMSCYQFFTFDICPFIYLPKQKQLYLVTNLSVNILYSEGDDSAIRERHDDGTFYGILREEVVNPDDIPKSSRDIPTPGSCEYLIITSHELKDQFIPLADWRKMTGITTEIITVEEIYAKYHFDAPQVAIKKVILEYYQQKGTMFVLLGGNHGVVPVQRCWGYNGEGDNTISADLFYACFDGTFNWDFNNNRVFGEVADNVDIAPEIFVTRAPVPSAYHAKIFVDKTLQYEQNPPTSGFAEEMVNFGVEVFSSYGGRNDAAWLTEQMFAEYVDPFWNGSHFSFYAMDSTGTSYDINNTLLNTEIGKGRNFTFMASHGFPDSWKTEMVPFYKISDVYELNNTNEQGLVVTIACLTNAFDDFLWNDITTGMPILYDSCFSESFLRNPNGGAVAYYGSSRYGWGLAEPIPDLGPSFLYDGNFFRSLFSGQPHSNKFKLGAVAARSKIHLIGPSAQDGAYRWLQYTLNTLGDPLLDILTNDPGFLELLCPDSIPLGNTEMITIHTGLPFSNLCIQNGEDLYISDVANAAGDLVLDLTPCTFNPLLVTVTAHNMIYSMDTILVGGPEGAVVIMDNITIMAGNDQQIEYCERVTANITFKNIGIDTAFNTSIRVSSDDDYIEFQVEEAEIGSIPPGESIIINHAFEFDLNCYVPDKHFIDICSHITSNNFTRNELMQFVAYAPDIVVEGVYPESGFHHYLKANDSTKIIVNILNRGGADASNLRAFLTSEGGDYLIYDFADTNQTTLNAGEFAALKYGIYNWSEIGSEIPLIQELNADNYATVDNFCLQVIDSLENFETRNFNLYPWDLSLGDSGWLIDSTNAYNGRFCAKSGPVSRFQSSVLQLEMDIEQGGNFSFFRKVSDISGPNNKLEFYIDSILLDSWSGRYDWAKQSYILSPGVHVFTWKYYKVVNSINDTADCAWIDYITFPECMVSVNSVSDVYFDDERLLIYPNPSNGTFNLVLKESFSGAAMIQIFDLQGKVIFKDNLAGLNENSARQISIGRFSPGIYLLKITNNEFTINCKLLLR